MVSKADELYGRVCGEFDYRLKLIKQMQMGELTHDEAKVKLSQWKKEQEENVIYEY